MSKDPFQRLQKLLRTSFPKGIPETVRMHVGDPKGDAPAEAVAHVRERAEFNRYPPLGTLPVLQDAIAHYTNNVHGASLNREQIAAVQGTKSGLAWLPAIMRKKGQRLRVGLPDLAYPVYYTAAALADADILFYSADHDLRDISLSSLDYLIINTPHNPLGKIVKPDELKSIVARAREGDFVLVSDECYIDIYTKEKPMSALEADESDIYTNVLVFNSLSKSQSLAGLRSGYIAGDANLVQHFGSIYTTMGNAIGRAQQEAAALAWKNLESIAENRTRYKNFLEQFGRDMNLPVPEGAFYFFVDTQRDSEDFVVSLVRDAGIQLMPGKYLDYSNSGQWDNYVRIPVAEKISEKTMEALCHALNH